MLVRATGSGGAGSPGVLIPGRLRAFSLVWGAATLWKNLDEWKALVATGETPDASLSLRKDYIAEIKAAPDARTIDFTISTGSVDRDRDTIAAEGWKLAAFKKNPTVLWAHDYSMPPVARASKIHVEDNALKATAEFAPADIYPFAETIYQLLKSGFLKATSVGFRPLTNAFNADRGGMDFLTQELLEFSIVPVPANADCLMEGKAAGIDVEPLREWAAKTLETLRSPQIVRLGIGEVLVPWVRETASATSTTYSFGWRTDVAPTVERAVPSNPNDKKADKGEAWSAPSLREFTATTWDDLSDTERRGIAKHFAWANQMPPDSFGDLKLPHHRASDGAVVFRGVAAAAGRLGQTQGVDEAAVRRHLAAHYRQFDETPPWEAAAIVVEAKDDEFDLDAIPADEPDDECKGLEAADVLAALRDVVGAEVAASVRTAVNSALGRVD